MSQHLFERPCAIAPEAAMTFDAPEGFAIVRSLGGVRAEAVVPRNFIRATFRTIGTFIGLSPAEVLTDAERGRSEALHALLGTAYELGANGVVKLRFDASEASDGSTHVTASGEALILDPPPGFATRGSRL